MPSGRPSVLLEMVSTGETTTGSQAARHGAEVPRVGFLIVNADDWGRDLLTTDRILECIVP